MPSITSSQIVEITLGILIAFSVITWGLIFYKTWELWRLQRSNRNYGQAFWAAPNLWAASELNVAKGTLATISKACFQVLR